MRCARNWNIEPPHTRSRPAWEMCCRPTEKKAPTRRLGRGLGGVVVAIERQYCPTRDRDCWRPPVESCCNGHLHCREELPLGKPVSATAQTPQRKCRRKIWLSLEYWRRPLARCKRWSHLWW